MPLKRLTSRFLEKVWGSRRSLQPWFPDRRENRRSVVRRPGARTALLVKFLFTSEKLSVQVHPDDAYAARHPDKPRGKTEMWHILAAEPGAKIAAGFREPVSERSACARRRGIGRNRRTARVARGRPGDTFFIPAGTVHAIGAGLVSVRDPAALRHHLSPVRLRPSARAAPRTVTGGGPAEAACGARSTASGEELVSCEYFTVGRREFAGQDEFCPAPGAIRAADRH